MLGSASSPQVDLDCIIEGTIFPPGSCICLCFRSLRGPTVMGFGQCFITGSETKQSVLDPATSLKVLIISRRFLVDSVLLRRLAVMEDHFKVKSIRLYLKF